MNPEPADRTETGTRRRLATLALAALPAAILAAALLGGDPALLDTGCCPMPPA